MHSRLVNRLTSLVAGLFVLVSVLASCNALAVIVNPNPAVLADDVGVEIFTPDNVGTSVELFDPLAAFTSFGFCFKGTDVTKVANLVTIFDQGSPQVAAILSLQGKQYSRLLDCCKLPG